jgi:uncharacterized OB-fold protein
MTFRWPGIETRNPADVPSVKCDGCGKVVAPKRMTDWARWKSAPRGWYSVYQHGVRKDYCTKCRGLFEE